MSMIRVENLTFSYSSSYDTIFDNAAFQIDTDWKLGFVGRNGSGKSSLLKLLLKLSDRTYRDSSDRLRTCNFLCSAGYLPFERYVI